MKKYLILALLFMTVVISNEENTNAQVQKNCITNKEICYQYDTVSKKLSVSGKNHFGRFGIDKSTRVIPANKPIVINDKVPGNEKILEYRFGLTNVAVLSESKKIYTAGHNDNGQFGLSKISQSGKFLLNPLSVKYSVKEFDPQFKNDTTIRLYNEFYTYDKIYISNNKSTYKANYAYKQAYEDYDIFHLANSTYKSRKYTRNYNKFKKKNGLQTKSTTIKKEYNINGVMTKDDFFRQYVDTKKSTVQNKWKYSSKRLIKKYKSKKVTTSYYALRNHKNKLLRKYDYSLSNSNIVSDTRRVYSYFSNETTINSLKIYTCNKMGELKSTKNGSAYRYITSYKNGVAKNTVRQKYDSAGKLEAKKTNVKIMK